MNNNLESKLEKVAERVDKMYDKITDRAVAHVYQAEKSIEKDVDTAKKAIKNIIDASEVVYDAVTNHYSELLNGEKLDLSKEKERAISTIDKLAEKADEYYEGITDRIIEKADEHFKK